MKKALILKELNSELLDKIMGFAYARTGSSQDAEELCSDIVYELVKAGHKEGEIQEFHAFVWKVAHNVYADYSEKRQKKAIRAYQGDPEEVFENMIALELDEEDYEEEILRIVNAISFLTKAYRDVMILYYFEGKSVAEIADFLNVSETAVRQRLFFARNTIKDEVLNMNELKKPIMLEQIDYEIIGTGNPDWGDPRDVCTRQLSKHIVWSCFQKPKTVTEISKELNIPMPYVEEELDILTKGANGEYGLLREVGKGRYGINFILLDKQDAERSHNIYLSKMPCITEIICNHIEEHKDEYLALPYLNRKVSLSLILWKHFNEISFILKGMVECYLKEEFFTDVEEVKRPFSVFGYVDNGKYYGCGHDGIGGYNICGYSAVGLENINISWIKQHFCFGHNIGNDKQIQLAVRAIHGIPVCEITEEEKEIVAKTIECGYIYREGDMLYTKILVYSVEQREEIYKITYDIGKKFTDIAREIATEIRTLMKKSIPDYLLNEFKYVNLVAGIPLVEAMAKALIEKGYLEAPENGMGAEGCWMYVKK